MDQDILVRFRIEDGERLIRQITADGVEVFVAFWAIIPDEEQRNLFVALPGYEGNGMVDVRSRVSAAMRKSGWRMLESPSVQLVSSLDPMAQAIRARLRDGPLHLGGISIAGKFLDACYVYSLATYGSTPDDPPPVPRLRCRIVGVKDLGTVTGPEQRVVVGELNGPPWLPDFQRDFNALVRKVYGDMDGFNSRFRSFLVEYPREGRWETDRFTAKSAEGKEVVIVEHTTFPALAAAPNGNGVAHLKDFTTVDGRRVNLNAQKGYELMPSGEVYYPCA